MAASAMLTIPEDMQMLQEEAHATYMRSVETQGMCRFGQRNIPSISNMQPYCKAECELVFRFGNMFVKRPIPAHQPSHA